MASWFKDELGKDFSVELEKLCGSPSSIVNRALISIYDEISGGKTLEATHVNAIKQLAIKGIPHSSVSLPAGIDAVIEEGKLCFVHQKKSKETKEFNIALESGRNAVECAELDIFINIEPYSKNIYKNSILLSIASAKINGVLTARSRQAGDKILSGKIHKSVKKLMNEKKIPLELRDRLPIICDEYGILAIPFVAIRDGAKAPIEFSESKKTKITVCMR